MKNISMIIASMSNDVRGKAEAYARAKGVSLEDAVSQQLEHQLSDADLASVVGGTEFNVESGGTEFNVESGTQIQ